MRQDIQDEARRHAEDRRGLQRLGLIPRAGGLPDRQLIWLERRSLGTEAPDRSPLRPLVREWLRARAPDPP